MAIPGKDPAAAFCKRLTHQSVYWCSFVSIRGSSFPFVDIFFPSVSFFVALHGSLSSLFQPLGVPWRITLFDPCPTFGGSLSSLLQPLSGPSSSFVALRGYLFAFSWKSFPPARPLAEPSRASSNPFVALRRSSWPFVDIFLPFSFVLFVDPLRGYLFSLACRSEARPRCQARPHPISAFCCRSAGFLW